MNHESSTFLSGCCATCEFFFFSKELDELVNEDQPNASFFCFDETDDEAQFRKYDDAVGWPAVAMATFKKEGADRVVVALGPNGDYWELAPASTVELVGTINGFTGNLRNLSVVDGDMFACGMGREVLRRETRDNWVQVGPNPLKGDPAVVGFEDIGGYNSDEMYTVGWGGEIWWRDNGRWKQVDSPTSANLRALVCAEQVVYVVGHDGTMIKGRRDVWELIDTGRKEKLMDVAEFEGSIYVCTDFRILKLADKGLVNETDFRDPDDRPATCLNLLTAPDGVISLGQKDVFIRKHSGSWARLV